MKKYLKMLKNLPPEVKMMMAMLGMGSLGGAIFFFKRMFFPRVPLYVVILCVVAAVAVVALLVFLISRLFKSGSRRRSKQMADQLAHGAQAGPQSMEKGADIKGNTDKFFKAIRDMRKDVGIDVYELPWYIVMGDSGCGKTKLINEGGLTFSRGKPEGYQLGTLNYNWWFTEEAIFIDMAGRLCNPQDDEDRREWSALLETIAKGRKGFPINGALVCVSADHLLQDPPEKVERDAITALERLRDLQTRLGVTFATYLVITKCDKILGFMQFFDRAERDITIKNQIFGWSRPGKFTDPFDPETFQEGFSAVYSRLTELRLRRLNDESEEQDLGLAYSFPEEFRGLVEPLQIYVSTLFPLIHHAKAVKNLIFRGVYFTSATQEGSLILTHLAERLGQEAADQFAPLDDLYPHKRPHFIKDVLRQKVIPEHGLVFRNEQQVVRNRKLNKLLKIGTIVATVILLAAFAFSAHALSLVMESPRNNAEKAAQEIGAMRPGTALALADSVEQDVVGLKRAWLARWVVSVIVGAGTPIQQLDRIRGRLVEKGIIEALIRIDGALRDGELLRPSHTEKEASAYVNALAAYLSWYGCRNEPGPTPALSQESFETLCAVVPRDSTSIVDDERFLPQVRWYFSAIAGDGPLARNPANLLETLDVTETIKIAVGHLYDHLTRYATFDENHPDRFVREWNRIRNQCELAKKKYDDLLETADEAARITTLASFRDLRERFAALHDSFDGALQGCSSWQEVYEGENEFDIPMLSARLLAQRARWTEFQQTLAGAAERCPPGDSAISLSIESITAGGTNPDRKGQDRLFWESLKAAGIVAREYGDGVYDAEMFPKLVHEVHDIYSEIVVFTPSDAVETKDRLGLTAGAATVRGRVQAIRARVDGADVDARDARAALSPQDMIDAMYAHFEKIEESQEQQAPDTSELPVFWRPDGLGNLDRMSRRLVVRSEGTSLLGTIHARLSTVEESAWGIAELVPGFPEEVAAPYSIPIPTRHVVRNETPRAGKPAEVLEPRKRRRSTRRRRGAAATQERAPAPAVTPRAPFSRRLERTTRIPVCASHEFLTARASDLADLLRLLRITETGDFLEDQDSQVQFADRCIEVLADAGQAYMDAYVRVWSDAYRKKTFDTLNKLEGSDWDQLVRRLGGGRFSRDNTPVDISDELEQGLLWILRAVPLAQYHPGDRCWWGAHSDPEVSEEFMEVSEWMLDAIDKEWASEPIISRTLGRALDLADPNRLPWDAVTGEFVQAWDALYRGIAENGFPKRLERSSAWSARPIPWGQLQSLREKWGLDAEDALTGSLVNFELRAQKLLSGRVTGFLIEIQKGLGGVAPDGGWPYLPGRAYTESGLSVVSFSNFTQFLVKVHRAEKSFKEFEKSFPEDDAGRDVRVSFYESCQAWFSFLGLSDQRDAVREPLTVTVTADDPLVRPYGKERVEATCQFTAAALELDLGLSGVGGHGVGGQVLSISTERQNRKPGGHKMEWPWSEIPGKVLTVRLVGFSHDVTDPGSKTLGTHSPLALCAYLRRYGVTTGDRKVWYVTHSFERVAQGAANQKVGEQPVFTLGSPMPEPIRPLEDASMRSPG